MPIIIIMFKIGDRFKTHNGDVVEVVRTNYRDEDGHYHEIRVRMFDMDNKEFNISNRFIEDSIKAGLLRWANDVSPSKYIKKHLLINEI